MRRSSARIALTAVCLALASCGLEWAPSGSARVLGWHDSEEVGVRTCVVYLEASNVGSLRIERSSLSFRVFTAARSYYRTLVIETPLPPGGLVYAEASVVYADPGESAEADGGVELVNSFFE